MYLSLNVIGDAFADVYCYLGDADLPSPGGDARLVQPMHAVAGGSGVNTATHLASLLRHFWTADADEGPHRVHLQTVVDESDGHGQLILSHCGRHGVHVVNRRASHLSGRPEEETSTGHCAVIVSKGDRSFMTHLGCMADFRGSQVLTNFLDERLSTHHHVHIAGYYNIEGFWNGELEGRLREMRETQDRTKQKLTMSLVPQHDATDAWDGGLLRLLPYLDFLILNEVEAKHMTKFPQNESEDGRLAFLWRALGFFSPYAPSKDDPSDFFCHVSNFFQHYERTCVIVTRGSKGAVALYRGMMLRQSTLPEIGDPPDPTGAGDAFAAGFLHGYLRHRADRGGNCDAIKMEAVEAGMQWACAAGTCCVMVQGASVPATKEILEQTRTGIANIAEREEEMAE